MSLLPSASAVEPAGLAVLTRALSQQTPALLTRTVHHAIRLHRRSFRKVAHPPPSPCLARSCCHRASPPAPWSTQRLSRPSLSRSFSTSSRPPSPDPSSHLDVEPSSSLVPTFPASVNNVRQVGNPRLLMPPSFVSDAAQLLAPSDSAQLNDVLNRLHSDTRAEVALVTLASLAPPAPSSPPPEPRPFALELFNHFGVGDRRLNTGVLVLLVRDSRRIEIITGDGARRLYGLTDDVVQRLLDDGMVPHLRKGEWGPALLGCARVLDAIIRASPGGSKAGAAAAAASAVGAGGGGWGGGAAQELLSKLPGGVSPTVINWLIALAVGFIAYRVVTAQPTAAAPSSAASKCVTCQGQLLSVGVVDARNLRSSSSLSEVPRADSAATPPSPLAFVPANLHSSDYAVDYQHILDTITPEQRRALEQGKAFDVSVCADCGTLYVEPRDARAARTGRELGGLSRREGLGGVAGPVVGGWTPAAGGLNEFPRSVVWLPERETRAVQKGVRREEVSVSSSSGSGFSGGSSSGGGGGASF